MGAVFGTRAIVQRIDLGSRWLCRQRVISRNDVVEAARPLYALKQAIAELVQWYTELDPVTPVPGRQPSFMFPYFTSFAEDGEEVKFAYLKAESLLPSCSVFYAELEKDQREVVVKFVETYNAEAHQHMAEHNLAPKLLHCGELPGIGYEGRMMIVMEKVEGNSLFDLYHSSGKPVPSGLKGPLADALAVLKQGGFIFPDLRTPNVMLTITDGAKDEYKGRVRLIDFDWVCREESGARYPFYLSKAVEKSGAVDHGLIKREHQDKMLEHFFDEP